MKLNEVYDANVKKGDELVKVDPDEVQIGDIIVIDDMKKNLDDITNKFSDTKINLHLYNMI